MTESKPTFVIGSQRSGTTMFRLMLNSHPLIAVPHESAFITVFYRRLSEYGDLAHHGNMERLLRDICEHQLVRRGRLIPSIEDVLSHAPPDYPALIEAIFSCYAAREGKSIWCDKTPFYTEDIDLLNEIFPHSRFIHVVRDGRDVAVSQQGISWLPSNLPEIANRWKLKTTLCHKVGAVLTHTRFIEIRYEDLVLDSENVLRRVCEFLGVDYTDQMLDYHKTASSVVPAESIQWHRNSVQRPDAGKVYEWRKRMPRSDRVIFEQYAGDALELFNYEREYLKPTAMSMAKKVYFATLQRN